MAIGYIEQCGGRWCYAEGMHSSLLHMVTCPSETCMLLHYKLMKKVIGITAQIYVTTKFRD